MALTQQEWYDKLKNFVPTWWFSQGGAYTPALFWAMAAVFTQLEEDSHDQFVSTFFTTSEAPVLDIIGYERQVDRISGEADALYVARVQNITSHSNVPDIKALVDSLLIVPGCEILEAPDDSPYCSRGAYCSRNTFMMELRQNYFLVVLPRQVHAPYSFTSRSYFCSRSAFAGSVDVTSGIFPTIIAAVDAVKAFGVMWGMVERAS